MLLSNAKGAQGRARSARTTAVGIVAPVDPDGLECEVLMTNPDAVPGVVNPPGTPAKGY